MNDQVTIIIAARDDRLIESIQQALTGARVLLIEAELPPDYRGRPDYLGRPDYRGRNVWCFVDLLLPSISGFEVCRRLREAPATMHSHITLVLDEDDRELSRRSIHAGADDYVKGPLSGAMVLERISRHHHRGTANLTPRPLRNGDIVLDPAAHQMRYRSRLVPLGPNEFQLIAHFIEHPDQLFSRRQLITQLGKDLSEIDERTVDVWVGRLRRALKHHGVPDQLRTVRSQGYVLDSIDRIEPAAAA